MKEKNKKNNSANEEFLGMSMWTTDMLEDPNAFFKDMALQAAAIEIEKQKKK